MAYQAGIVGGSGYTGAELLRLLAGHPDVDVVHVTADSNAGATVGDLYPSLTAGYPGLEYLPVQATDLAGLDVVFLCLPHGESQRVVPELIGLGPHIVDLGADFRLPAEDYPEWYGQAHSAPELLNKFAFGLPELFRSHVQAADHVASPGCYPTAAALALAPLFAHEVVESTGVIVDSMSGLSGAGRGLKVTSHFSEADESVAAYNLLTHRHTPEIEHALGHVAGEPVSVLFTPHLVPMVRGIHATCHARPRASGLSTTGLLELYADFYAAEPFVVVVNEPSPTKATTGSNACHVTVRFDERTQSVLAIGVIDNLVKGASGQAIQNANLLLDLPETSGLSVLGTWP